MTDLAFVPAVLDSAMVGQVIGRREVEVDFRSSALYAAAIGAERDTYLDDRLHNGAIAPPAFITSLEWPLVSGPEFLIAIGIAPHDLFPRLLHMFQDSTFAAPIRAGDRLALEATLESVDETRSGAMIGVRIRTVNTRSLALVAESWFGGFFRDMKVLCPRTAQAPPAIPMFDLQGAIDRQAMTISRAASHIYNDCARLRNPIHTDLSFATALGLPDIALHGTLLWAKMGEIAIDRYLEGDPANMRRLAVRFRRPILPARAMTVQMGIVGNSAGQVSLQLIEDQSGEVLCEGLMEFYNKS